jgi:hypothetical protein
MMYDSKRESVHRNLRVIEFQMCIQAVLSQSSSDYFFEISEDEGAC